MKKNKATLKLLLIFIVIMAVLSSCYKSCNPKDTSPPKVLHRSVYWYGKHK